MYGLSEELFNQLVYSIKVAASDPNISRKALVHSWGLVEELQEIKNKSDAITWCIGYAPEIYISEYIANQILQFKGLINE